MNKDELSKQNGTLKLCKQKLRANDIPEQSEIARARILNEEFHDLFSGWEKTKGTRLDKDDLKKNS